ncbi:hypothetical protein [Mycobacteroides abscessus]|uniref:hypothetical protein n=1 Tax=Mycobacteroides abscessus TaxID=36809 RepID=UPI000C25B3C2
MKKEKLTVLSEPMVDDDTLEWIKEQETEELLLALVEYTRSLQEQVVDLRCKLNRNTYLSGQKVPFPEPHSDLYKAFDDYAAYPKFKHLFKLLE